MPRTLQIESINSNSNITFTTSSASATIERLRIDSAGNVGIRTTSPVSTLTIGSGTNTYPTTPAGAGVADITLNATNLARLVMNDGTGNFQQYLNSYYDTAAAAHKYTAAAVPANRFTTSAGTFAFYVAPASTNAGDTITWTTGLYIDNSGRVGIGTATPVSKLAAVGTASNSGGISLLCTDVHTLITNDGATNGGKIQVLVGGNSSTIGTTPYRLLLQPEGGDVGIGTVSPITKLHVSGAGTTSAFYTNGDAVGQTLYLQDTGSLAGNGGQILFGANQGIFAGIKSSIVSGTGPAGNLIFQTRSTSGNVLERMSIDSSGNVTVSTGSYINTRANNTAEGGGQIYLNGATGNRIDFSTAGVQAPAFTTRSLGTKIVLYPGLTAAAVDYAFGIENNTLWSSVPSSASQFKWYAGTTNIATLSGAGVLTATTFSGALSGNAATVTNGVYLVGTQTITGRKGFSSSVTTGSLLNATGSLGSIEVFSDNVSNASFLAFHRPTFAAYFGVDTDNQFAVGGWSYGAALGYMKVGSFGVGTAASGTAGEVRATNNITAYYSDERLKNFIGKISNALDKVNSLNGYYYKENSKAKELGYNNDSLQVGISAQEVEKILPEIVTLAPIDCATDSTGKTISKTGENYKTVYYEKLIPLLIEAIKELSVEVNKLKHK
jgi:hypothetical protein